MKGKRILSVIVINIAVFLILVLIIEGLSRVFFPRPMKHIFSNPNFLIVGRHFIKPDPKRGFALKPFFSNHMYRINSKGFRGREFPRNLKSYYVIVTLGESTTFGWAVKGYATYPYYLNECLNKNELPPVYVINGGVPSYSSTQVKIYLEEIIDEIHPDLIIVNEMWNDIWYSSLTNWYPDVLVFQCPPKWRQFLLKNSNFYRFMFLSNKPVEKNVTGFNHKAFNQYRKNMNEMIEICRKKGLRLAFVVPPFNENLYPVQGLNPFNQALLTKSYVLKILKHYINELEKISRENHIPLIDHSLSIHSKTEKDKLFLDFAHPNSKGNQMMAAEIADYLTKHNLIKGQPSVPDIRKGHR